MSHKQIPFDKMSKKAQKEKNAAQRNLWPIPPVTKRIENKKLYNRKKKEDMDE